MKITKSQLKSLIKEEFDKINRREEEIIISRALFEDLVSKIAKISIEEVEEMTDVEKENILLNFSKRN